jgi:hypothetical protein
LPRLFPILSLPYKSWPFLPLLKITRQRHLRFDVRFLFTARSQSQVTTTWPLSLTYYYVCTDWISCRLDLSLLDLLFVHIYAAALVRFGRDLLGLTSVCTGPDLDYGA